MNADPALKDVTIKFGNRILNLPFRIFYFKLFTIAATDDVKQDEQNKNEVYEEIAPIRRDSQKKRIRTNSIAKRGRVNVSDVMLNDVTVKFGNRIVNLHS